MLFHATGCYPRFAVLNKNHEVYVYRRDPFTTTAVQELQNDNYTGQVAYDARTRTMVSANLDGMRAYRFDATCVPHVIWSIPGTSGPGGQLGQAVSPPAIANGVVYYGNGAGPRRMPWTSRPEGRCGSTCWVAPSSPSPPSSTAWWWWLRGTAT